MFTLSRCVVLSVYLLLMHRDSSSVGQQVPQGQGEGQKRFCNYTRTLEFYLPISCNADVTGDEMCPPGERFVGIQHLFPDTVNDTDDSGLTTPSGSSGWTTSADSSNWTTALPDSSARTTPPNGPEGNNTFDRNCQLVCAKDFSNMPACCPGFFGPECRECPRGKDGITCSGRGHCRDGFYNDGRCQCQDQYAGLVCELCRNSTMYGPACTEECECVNGVCDNGPAGNGTCRQCYPGYQGPLCTQEIITCANLTCSNNSQCQETDDGQAECVCQPGFQHTTGNDTSDCQPINKCSQSTSLCGENAECIPTGPGTYECQCQPNYHGDGYMCLPINPCETDNGGCDKMTTVCMNPAPNVSQCDCMAGYEAYVAGSGCSLIDVCVHDSCHPKATCTTVAPYESRCTCNSGYIGDGVNCHGNIIEELGALNKIHPTQQGQLSMAVDLLKNIYLKPLQDHGPFTIFVPNNRAFRKASRRDFSYTDMLREVDRSQQVLRQHILIGNLTLEDLQAFSHFYTLQGSIADLQVRVAKDVFKFKLRGYASKAKVIARDLPAANGMIHIVNELLINDPEIIGDASSLGMESHFERDNITVFAPENGGLDGLPEGTLDYLTTDEDGKIKLRTLLNNHIFPGKIVVTDLINLKRIHSLANYAFSVSITDMGRIQLNGQVNVSQVNIPCSNAVYYHIDGPLIPPELADILPSRCDVQQNRTVKGRCQSCTEDLKCPLDTDIFTNEVSEGCHFWGHLQGRFTQIQGCQTICQRTHSIPRCCPGFYGQDCKPCPGGHKNPCGGHGECNDEMYGSGFCVCDRNFRGTQCELCLDRNKFGPNCTDGEYLL
ncbi:hypothetical protein BaRGS_00019026 [Batillaria attramentaria]|uniref:Stabilin-2-like n=1 Tax=Batillaria attramentaria TaxID=370345 RepID=A0ABD0KR95_9CAEN